MTYDLYTLRVAGLPRSRSPTHVEEGLPQASEAFPSSGEDHDQGAHLDEDEGDVDAMNKTRLALEAAREQAAREAKVREEAKRQKEKEEEERDLTPEEEARLLAHWERRRVLYERVSVSSLLSPFASLLSSTPNTVR